MTTRIERTENCYRNALREQLIGMLKVINPADQITYGAMKYEDLVEYARDWLNTEIAELLVNAQAKEGAIGDSEPIKTISWYVDGKFATEEPDSLSLEWCSISL